MLTERRPDLTRIELTKENTERVLPYIDLANEVDPDVLGGAALGALFGLTDYTGLIEDLLRKPGTAVWEEMKNDARRPFFPDDGDGEADGKQADRRIGIEICS